jgi:hypothetical protein
MNRQTFDQASKDLWEVFNGLGDEAIPIEKVKLPESPLIKIYYYGRYGEVEVHKYKDYAITVYVPTAKTLVWKNKNKAFTYAAAARDYVNHL